MLNIEHGNVPLSTTGQGRSAAKRGNSVHLDALRGLAALFVAIYHWHGTFQLPSAPDGILGHLEYGFGIILDIGPEWVVVFFVLSGYLVGGSVLRSLQNGRWSWRSYLFMRLTRLYTVLLPALIIGGILDWSGMHLAPNEGVYSVNAGVHSLHKTLTPGVLAANAFFLQTIALPAQHGNRIPCFGSNGVLWSLTNEFWYYLAFPVMAIAMSKAFSLRARLACGGVLLIWGWFVGIFIVLLSIPWLMGFGISRLRPFAPRRELTRRAATAGALGLFIFGLLNARLHRDQYMLMSLLLGLLASLLIWTLLYRPDHTLPNWYVQTSKRAAQSSYTLYLVHVPFLVFVSSVLKLPPTTSEPMILAVSLGELLALLIFARLVYHMFERNTDRFRALLKPIVFRPAPTER